MDPVHSSAEALLVETPLQLAIRGLQDRLHASPRLRLRLSHSECRRNMFDSALDVVVDTEYALNAYLEIRSTELGLLYLSVYGALQALVVQQDASKAIVEHCGLTRQQDVSQNEQERLDEFRDVRHCAVGHPTHANKLKQLGYPTSFIVQLSLEPGGFDLHRYDQNGTWSKQYIDVRTMILDQRRILAPLVDRCREHLLQVEREHMRKYRDDRLAGILESKRWHLQKALELVHSSDAETVRQRGSIELDMVEKALTELRSQLEERGDWASHEGVNQHSFTLMLHCIERMRACFEAAWNDDSVRLDAHAFGARLWQEFESLQKFMEELDAEYGAEQPEP